MQTPWLMPLPLLAMDQSPTPNLVHLPRLPGNERAWDFPRRHHLLVWQLAVRRRAMTQPNA